MHTNWKSRHLTIALALGLGAAGSTPIALAGNADVAPSASPAAGEASSGGASSPAKANAPAPDPNSPLLLELRDLKATVQAQADQVNARSQELESERAALGEELQRIAALEAKLGVAPAASTASTAAPAAAASAALPAANAASDPERCLPPYQPWPTLGRFRLQDRPLSKGRSRKCRRTGRPGWEISKTV